MSKFTPTDRKEFLKLVDNRTNALMSAMNGDLLQNKEDLKREVLKGKGFEKNSDEVYEEIQSVKSDLADKVSEAYEGEQQSMEVRIAEETEKLQQELRELTNEFQKKKTDLTLKIALVKENIMGDAKKLEDKIAKEKFPESLAKIETLTKEQEAVKNIEEIVEADIRNKIAMIRKFRYRMESSIRDKSNRVKEALVMCDDKDEAQVLVKSIPTVEELIIACQGANGINDLIATMSPKLMLPLATETSESLKNAVGKQDITPQPEPKKEEEPQRELEGEAKVISIEASEEGVVETVNAEHDTEVETGDDEDDDSEDIEEEEDDTEEEEEVEESEEETEEAAEVEAETGAEASEE
jgi:hypothetical protein